MPLKNREYRKKYAHKYYLDNKEEILVHRRNYFQTNRPTMLQKRKHYYQRNPEIWQKKRTERRLRVLNIVGKGVAKCVYCGCDDMRLLEINHKNGGGAKEIVRSGDRFWGQILDGRRGIDDLEVTCRVCNAWHYHNMKFGCGKSYTIIWNKSAAT